MSKTENKPALPKIEKGHFYNRATRRAFDKMERQKGKARVKKHADAVDAARRKGRDIRESNIREAAEIRHEAKRKERASKHKSLLAQHAKAKKSK